MVESLLLTVTRVMTKAAGAVLTHATGFFFERDEQLFLVTNRHVVISEPENHRPDSLDIEIHINAENLAETVQVTLALYEETKPLWREATDAGGLIDVVALPIAPGLMPESAVYRAFTPDHMVEELDDVEVGTRLLVVGFPLGFHDTLHRLPVVRQAIIASAFGFRFQGSGCFLTDGRTHRGISGAPVVSRVSNRPGRTTLPFALLGVHASRIDMGTRDLQQDESLGINCAWYADTVLVLTDPPPPEPPPAPAAPAAAAPPTVAPAKPQSPAPVPPAPAPAVAH
jgi:hypothetical protein